MKLNSGLLTECFMLQVVALRTTYGQLREGKQRFWSRKRRQTKRLWDLDTWFGTRRSKVQILSPRPFFYNQRLTLIQIANERLVRDQEIDSSNPIVPTISFPSQINVLRRILNCHL